MYIPKEWTEQDSNLPQGAALGGAETVYPEYQSTLSRLASGSR